MVSSCIDEVIRMGGEKAGERQNVDEKMRATPINRDRQPRNVGLRAAANSLFASPTLVDLCVLFFRNPERRYYVNELVKESGRFPRSVQLALSKLEAASLVHSEKQANAKFYRVDVDHPFFTGLEAIFRQVPDLTSMLRQALGAIEGVVVAFLRPNDSDAGDLLLVVVGDTDRGNLDQQVRVVAERSGKSIQVEIFSTDDWRRQARRERSYVRWLLEEPRQYLVGDDTLLPSP
ncbi:MAG TPA: hypothetical protein VNG11_05435 [Chloroflexota bacterium]|nr:hypothetical protein [Chloroflexota bacterium]